MSTIEFEIPLALEAESRLLGGCMVSYDWVNWVMGSLKAFHFYSDVHKKIFSHMETLVAKDREITQESFMNLEGVKKEDVINLIIVNNMGLYPEDLIQEVLEAYQKRTLQTFGMTLIQSAMGLKSFNDVYQASLTKFFTLGDPKANKGALPINVYITDPTHITEVLQEKQQKRMDGLQVMEGTPSGYYDLDSRISGFVPGHFTIIGSRPGVGKTTFVINLINNLVLNCSKKVLFFSLEMPGKEIAEKLVCLTAEVSHRKYREGSVSSEDYQSFVVSAKCWEKKGDFLLIDDQPALSIDEVKARSMRIKKAHDIDIIFVDYIQLLHSPKNRESRHLEIGDISRKMKELAKTLNVPIVCIAQLNREVEKRTDKRPHVSDLRESGSLEADADEIMLLDRKEIRDPHDKPGLLQVYLAKNRFGPIGEFELVMNGETGALRNYVPMQKQNYH